MENKEIKEIIEMAKKPVERNMILLVNLKNGEEVHGELSQWNPESSVAELFDGEARTVYCRDILKAEIISQAELLRVVSSLKDERDSLKERNEMLLQTLKMLCDSSEERNEMLLQTVKMLCDSSKEVWEKIKL